MKKSLIFIILVLLSNSGLNLKSSEIGSEKPTYRIDNLNLTNEASEELRIDMCVKDVHYLTDIKDLILSFYDQLDEADIKKPRREVAHKIANSLNEFGIFEEDYASIHSENGGFKLKVLAKFTFDVIDNPEKYFGKRTYSKADKKDETVADKKTSELDND